MIVGLCRGVWREFLPNALLWDVLLVSEMPSSFVFKDSSMHRRVLSMHFMRDLSLHEYSIVGCSSHLLEVLKLFEVRL
jgi:hypothetical protein